MLKRSSLLLLPVLAAACAGAPQVTPQRAGSDAPLATTPSRRERIREILASNVRLEFRDGEETKRTASGVVVASEASLQGGASYILTNAHALDDRGFKDPRLLVAVERDGEEQEYIGEVLAVGTVPDMDLALLRVRGVRLPSVQLAGADELEVGEEVVVAASPFGRSVSLASGMVSRVELEPRTRVPRMVKTDAPVGYGSSGGGIYSVETGRLLAIVEGYRTAKMGFNVAEERYSFEVPMPGETFAAPASKVRAFMDANGLTRLLAPEDASAVSTAPLAPAAAKPD